MRKILLLQVADTAHPGEGGSEDDDVEGVVIDPGVKNFVPRANSVKPAAAKYR